MPLPSYYNELYVAFCTANGRVNGSGICFDGNAVITCAHVVNSALGRAKKTDVTDATGLEVKIRFSQSTLLDRNKQYVARVKTWCPAQLPAGAAFCEKFDLAVLELVSDTSDLEPLLPMAGELRFTADDLKNHDFSCTSHNVATQNADILPITGTISHYLPADGKTALSTSINIRDAFFRPGCSGSPVYSESLDGIAGIVDQLVDGDELRYAFMIDARRIRELLGELFPDLIVHQPSLKKKSRSNKKFLCDRKEVIEGIHTDRSRDGRQGNLFFLWGSDEQEGKAFSNRYDLEFIQPVDPTNSLVSIEVDLPDGVSNPDRFRAKLLDTVTEVAMDRNRRIVLKPGDDLLAVYRSLKLVKHRVFFFKILDYSPEQSACFEWFFSSFLKVGGDAYPPDLHVFVLFEFSATDTAAEQKRNDLFRLCNNPSTFHLRNVTKPEIRSWISTFTEEEESPFILTLKELLREQKEQWPMIDIYEQFDDAIARIPDINRL